MEVRACWSDGFEKLGDILNRSRYYMASSAQSDSYYRWCFYERNLIGDPETPCLPKRIPPQGGTVTITYPTDGSTVTGPITVTTSTTGCIDTVEFYVDGVLMYTDTSAPFEYSFDPCGKEDENMIISVIGYCSGVEEDTDSVTVYVDCIPDYITITSPSGGEIVCCTVNIIAETTGCIDEVRFYVDGSLIQVDTSAPFECSFYACSYPDGSSITIMAEGYCSGVFMDDDSVTITKNCYVTITNPPGGEILSGTVTVTAESNCDFIRWYIDGVFVYEDTTAPFQYIWDTTAYSDGSHTVRIDGLCGGDEGTIKATGTITYSIYNECSITITNPSDGETVSGTVTCTADSNCDSVKWYINGVFRAEDTTAPFQYSWDTTQEAEDQQSTVTAEGIVSGVVEDTDSVTVFVDNEGECLGTMLLALFVLFGTAEIYRRY
ncbi:MAG: hypothetical protein AYK19_13450 [Theionarchaea archaeon DG-70-1]|nr:MAG: hypothetical protein AYK19_13450 [Theionarchaea archaeon DG-70-1]